MSEQTRGAGRPGADGLAALLALGAALAAREGADGETGYQAVKREIREAAARDPFDATAGALVGGAFLFFLAEKGHNPRVKTLWDALAYVSTCLSVGYGEVHATTPVGKAIASAIMMVGPGLTAAIFDRGGAETEKSERESREVQAAMLARLNDILAELRARRSDA